ncbi:hypothetical protein G9F71_004610 [Clostridium sp. FP2]|uniref:ABC-three component system protein n=1 Tax=Clostridium sp. FP2 TaxID=2724481 RepID=UPI0013E97F6E|nr:ABC-three component system protein [Clostridium sp. FP2]MBZ9622141.1 hypothetical protein [Clostridium sp. FP2]
MPECNLEWDATPSWSGYNYQGKVALYVVLDKLCELYMVGKRAEISDWSLELEWIEDFSLMHKSGDGNDCKSIHQVKALDTTEIKDYGEAIFGLAAKVIEYNTIDEAYLHTWKPINIADADWKINIKILANRHRKETDLISKMEKLLIDNAEFTNTFNRILKPKSGSAPDIIKRIQPNIEGKITIETVKVAIEKAIVFGKQDSTRFMAKLTDECISKIHLFSYGDSNHCDLDAIKGKILEKTNKHLELQGGGWRRSDIRYKDIIYHYLMAEIDKNVVERHKTYAQNNKITIPFEVFENILKSQELSDHSKEYYLFHLKNKFFELHDDYCKRCTKKDEDIQICLSCNLVVAIDDVKNMDIETFEKFCRILCPDVKGKMDAIEVFQRIFESNGVNSCFFRALRAIKKEYEIKREMIRYTSKDKKTLLLTSLANNGTDNDSSHVCLNIIQNKDIDCILMDIDELVSKDFNEESIWECANKIGQIDEVSEGGFNYSDHICHCKKVSIKPIDDVIRRLSND